MMGWTVTTVHRMIETYGAMTATLSDSTVAKLESKAGENAEYRLPEVRTPGYTIDFPGWGGWIRTSAWRYQKPLPYRLATPQHRGSDALRVPRGV